MLMWPRVAMWPNDTFVSLVASPSRHKMALLAPGWLVPALAWLFEIPRALTHPGEG